MYSNCRTTFDFNSPNLSQIRNARSCVSYDKYLGCPKVAIDYAVSHAHIPGNHVMFSYGDHYMSAPRRLRSEPQRKRRHGRVISAWVALPAVFAGCFEASMG